MLRNYLIVLFALLLISGCGSDASENTNENLADNTANSNANTNQERVELEMEVPTFDNADTALKRGIEYLDANYIEQAINALKQAVKLDENLADAHFQLGVALSLKESAEEKTVTDEPEPEKTPSKSKKEVKTESEIAFENAIKAYKKLIAKNKKDHAAHYNLGRSYIKLFDDENARKALEQAVKLNDEDSLYRTELGSVLIKLAQYDQAIKQLKKAIEIDEANYQAEDLLVKATAGKKRVDFGQKDKPSGSSTSSNAPESSSSTRSTRSKPTPEKEKEKESKPPIPAPPSKKPNSPAA